MAGRKSDFTLTKLDDLFTTQDQREEEKLYKIRDIPLGLIDDFPDHPFKVRDDEDMLQLIESAQGQRGLLLRQQSDRRKMGDTNSYLVIEENEPVNWQVFKHFVVKLWI